MPERDGRFLGGPYKWVPVAVVKARQVSDEGNCSQVRELGALAVLAVCKPLGPGEVE
jgi:hypothetical protein